jgi:protein TonB
MSMSDRRYDPGLSPTSVPGQATYAPAPIDIRWFVGIAVAVPLFVAGGVYWLHHVPADPRIEARGGVLVEVSLVRSAEPAAEPELATASIQPEIEDKAEVLPEPEPPPEEAEQAQPLPTPTAFSPPSGQDLPPGALANLTPRASNSTKLSFTQTLNNHLLRFLPPKEFYGRKSTIVRVYLRRDGMVSNVWVKNTSGDFVFDQVAIDTIRRAQPFPLIPSDMPDQLSIDVPISSLSNPSASR